MKPRHKRAAIIAGGIAAIGLAAYFVLNAFESSLVFFFTPSQVASGEAPKNRAFRVGGMVKTGSVQRDNLTVSFIVTDTVKEVPVTYTGILPDLFREGKGVVAQGKLTDAGKFAASEVLAKHDENYMPPEAQHAMDQAQIQKAAQSLK
jgi:cytochrome c-type biogenesis protein CcmE